MIRLIINWVHLFAAITWLGAVVYNAFAIEGSRHRWRAGERIHIRAAMSQAFAPTAWVALSALVVSGFVKLHWHVEIDYPTTLASPWGRLLIGKWILAALLIGLGATTRYLILPSLKTASQTRNLGPETRREATRLEGLVTLFSWISFILAAGLVLIVIML